MAEISQQVAGYRLRSLLQTGQVSQVYEVVEIISNRHFAMKVLLPEHASDEEHRKNLFHEAEVGIKLRHENVIQIVRVDRSENTPHFIMEYFPAGSLRSRVLNKDTTFIREHAKKIFKHAATGLAYMHGSNWFHCDVKPDNLLVNALGELRIIDFAISKRPPTFFEKLFAKKKKPQGTPSYMSPEQILGEELDGRADIYSLGATFYELLAGRPPFRGNTMTDLLNKQITQKADSPQMHNKDVTDEMGALIVQMLAKKKAARPESCHVILQALQKIRVFKGDPLPGQE